MTIKRIIIGTITMHISNNISNKDRIYKIFVAF